MTNKLLTGFIGFLTLLAGLGGGVKLSENDFDNAYVCPLNEQVAIFNRLSSTGKTGYYIENNIEKQLQCRVGNKYEQWISLKIYSNIKGVNSIDLIKQSVSQTGQSWICDFNTCYLAELK